MGLSNYQLVLLDNLIYLDEVVRSKEKSLQYEMLSAPFSTPKVLQ